MPQFTLWPSLHATQGQHAEVTWEDLRAFVAAPVVSPTKKGLPGWSPAKFANDGPRKREGVVAVSALVLDVDAGGHALAAVTRAVAGFAGLVHSSWSHGHTDDGVPDPAVRKWRVVLWLSRDIVDDEHGALWAALAELLAGHGIALDRSTRTDSSRFWFVPGIRAEGAPYEWAELPGATLDVDAWLAAAPPEPEPARAPREPQAPLYSGAPINPAAEALGRAWPAQGRHQAQLALAGALRSEGWPEERAVDFLCAVCRVAGDEDRGKREATVRHTYSRPADAPTTGWTRLAAHVPEIVLRAVRDHVTGAGGLRAAVAERLAAAEARRAQGPSPTYPTAAGEVVVPQYGVTIPSGERDPNAVRLVGGGAGLAEPLPPLSYIVRELGLVSGGGAPHLVAGYGFSGKTMALQALLLALAAGVPVWGAYPVARPLRVLHIDLEQGDLTRRRFQRLALGMGVDLRSLGDRIDAAIMPRIKLTPDEVRWLDLMEGRDVIVVDSLRAACGGSENDSEFRGALDLLGEASHATGCRALVIHHAKKPGEDDTEARYSIRGSSAIYDAVDSAYVFGAAKGEPIRVEHVKARSHGDLEVDRGLVVSDVAIGGDPKGGLRVLAVSADVVTAGREEKVREGKRAEAVADAEVIRRILTRKPGLGRKGIEDAASAEAALGKVRVAAAMYALDASGDVLREEFGNGKIVKHYVKGGGQ